MDERGGYCTMVQIKRNCEFSIRNQKGESFDVK